VSEYQLVCGLTAERDLLRGQRDGLRERLGALERENKRLRALLKDAHGLAAEEKAGGEQAAGEHDAADLGDLGVAREDVHEQTHHCDQEHNPGNQHGTEGGAGKDRGQG